MQFDRTDSEAKYKSVNVANLALFGCYTCRVNAGLLSVPWLLDVGSLVVARLV
ncbi:hypothetical protein J522_3696 [Acinetobacter baumannii 146457]|nr:hypothetical protein J522_3696 [Acinetobacter baumannii 146457]